MAVHHNMELLVALVCPSDGVTGPLHVLRTYFLTHLLLHVEELRGVHMKRTGKVNFVGCKPPFERSHQALVRLHTAPKLLQWVCSEIIIIALHKVNHEIYKSTIK